MDPFCWWLTPESLAALAVEHLCLLDLACSPVLAGIWLAGVVATFAHTTAVQTVATILLQVEHSIIDVQHADATHQTRGQCCPLSNTEDRKGNTREIHFNVSLVTHSFKEPVILRPQDEQGLVPVPYTVKYCVSNVHQTKMDEFQELLSHSSYLPLETHFKSLLFSKLVPISNNQHFIICLITEQPTIYLHCPRLINFKCC